MFHRQKALFSQLPHLVVWAAMMLLGTVGTKAQVRITGLVTDTLQKPLLQIIVQTYGPDSAKIDAYTFTKADGRFTITPKTTAKKVKLTLSRMGYETKTFLLDNCTQDLGTIALRHKDLQLRSAVVHAPAVRVYGDTVEYNVAQLKQKTDRTIEDVIKRLPNVEVSADGTIKEGGKGINKFYIENMDLLGAGYTQATRNLAADDVSKIQVYHNHQPEKILKDVQYSDRSGMNLKINKKRLGKPIGHLKAGSGYGEQAKWFGELFSLFIARKMQRLITLETNNTADYLKPDLLTSIVAGNPEHYPTSQALLSLTNVPLNRMLLSDEEENRSAKTAFNQLFKLSDDHEIRVNAIYAFNRVESASESASDYYINDAERLLIEERTSNRTYAQKAALTTQYEINSDNIFLSNYIYGIAAFARTATHVAGTNNVDQRGRANDFQIRDDFTLKLKRKKNVIELSGAVDFASNPLQQLHIYNYDTAAPEAVQRLKGTQLYTYLRSGYTWTFSRFTNFSLSGYIVLQNDQLKSFSADDTINRNHGTHILASLSPSTSINLKHGTLSLSLPLQLVSKRYVDLLADPADNTFHYTRLVPRPRISFSQRFSSDLRHSISASYGETLGGFSSFILNPIRLNYRSTRTYGYGSMQISKALNTNYEIFYHNPIDGLSADFSARYSFGRRNSLQGDRVSTAQTTTYTLGRNTNSHQWGSSFNLKKYFYVSRLLFEVSGSASGNHGEILRQEMALHSNFYTYSARGALSRNFFAERLHTAVNASYNRSVQRQVGDIAYKQHFNSFGAGLNLSYFPHRDVELFTNATFSSVETKPEHYRNNFLLNGGMRYKQKKYEIELKANNLTNRHTDITHSYSGLDIFTLTRHLRPIEFILTVNWKF